MNVEIDSGETGYLTIDRSALIANYNFLKTTASGAQCAAVVKADAYGLGLIPVVQSLENVGCKTFFVASLKEGQQLRQYNKAVSIYVFDGLFPETENHFSQLNLIPVLGSVQEILDWSDHCRNKHRQFPAAIHIDTGMNRLGLGEPELDALLKLQKNRPDLLTNFKLNLVMSHLSCADEANHEHNREQLDKFLRLKSLLPDAPASLANSAGILLGPEYHLDLVRPGIALYGSWPLSQSSSTEDNQNKLNCVVRLYGRIAQVRDIIANQPIGYGAAYRLNRRTRVATVSVGYADGYLRKLGAWYNRSGAEVYINGNLAPLIGRVSMDLITVDVTDVPEKTAQRGEFVELIGPNVNIDSVGARAETISYEILTRLGRRIERHYI